MADDDNTLTDSEGRRITLRKLTVLDQARMLRAIGPYQSTNEPYVQLVFAAMSVADIDGVPVPAATNEKQIDGVIGRLGDEGMLAVILHHKQEIDAAVAAAEKAAKEGGDPKQDNPLEPPASS